MHFWDQLSCLKRLGSRANVVHFKQEAVQDFLDEELVQVGSACQRWCTYWIHPATWSPDHTFLALKNSKVTTSMLMATLCVWVAISIWFFSSHRISLFPGMLGISMLPSATFCGIFPVFLLNDSWGCGELLSDSHSFLGHLLHQMRGS